MEKMSDRDPIRLNHADPSDPDSQRCCRPIGIIRLKNTFLTHFLREEGGIKKRRCGGLVVSVPASRSPVPGSNLGPGPPQSAVRGAAELTVMLYCTNTVL